MATKKDACAKLFKMHFNGLVEQDGKTILKSFQILPVSSDCPIEGAIYDPSSKMLVIKTKTAHQETMLANKVSAVGGTVYAKKNGQVHEVKERLIVLSILENRITEREDIIDYVNALCGTTKFNDGTSLEEQLIKLDTFAIASKEESAN